MAGNFFLPFTLTILAGLSTVIGAGLIFWARTTCTKFLSFGLGLSAGVMIYLSFFELLKESNNFFQEASSGGYHWLVVLMFLVGLAIAGVIDAFTHNRMETCSVADYGLNGGGDAVQCPNDGFGGRCRRRRYWSRRQALLQTGTITAIVIALHNFPEGIITFTTASINPLFGLSVAIAIAIHNIPEGFCVALPIYYATQDKKKSILYALLAGLAEPLGALITYLILFPFINNFVLGIMLALVAGIMVYVAFDELLPAARRFGHGHISLFGLVVGMIIMAFSLYLLK
ncbi:MAG: zinc transporter ZupT [Patescibacteria group bacterium]|jgi:ZIP family zinc transporter